MAKIRVHELAKEREMSPRDMLAKLQAAGLPVKAVASAVDKQMAEDALAGKKVQPKSNGSSGNGGGTGGRGQPTGGTASSPRPLGTGGNTRQTRPTRPSQQAPSDGPQGRGPAGP